MFCLRQLDARCVPNQRLLAFIFLCGEVKKGLKCLHVMSKYCPTASWIQGSESVSVVNNTQGLTQGACAARETTKTCLCIYEAHLQAQIHTISHECDRAGGEVSDSFSASWRQIKSARVHSCASAKKGDFFAWNAGKWYRAF